MSYHINRPTEIVSICKAIGSDSRYNIYTTIEEPMSITEIAEQLELTAAHVSYIIKDMEKTGIINVSYEPGQHGVKKMVSRKYKQLVFDF